MERRKCDLCNSRDRILEVEFRGQMRWFCHSCRRYWWGDWKYLPTRDLEIWLDRQGVTVGR